MGVRRGSAPWWLTWVVAGGLVACLLGERVLGDIVPARLVLSGLGGVGVLGAGVWRFISWRHAQGSTRGVEGLLLLAYGGCALALIGFLVSSEDGMRWFGIAWTETQTEARYQTVVQVLSTILLTASILPALGAQWGLAAHRHAPHDAIEVETVRVRETAAGGLTVALAGAFLFLVGYIAAERDATVDLSYFKTASPGTAVQEIVRTFAEPFRVVLFFPEVNAVKDEVLGYFGKLAGETGRVEVVTYDRMLALEEARRYRVSSDGSVILERGDRSERLIVGTDLAAARGQLRRFDREVQERLLRLARTVRVAYLTVGHGELNDPEAADSVPADPPRTANGVNQLLRILNYRAEALGLREGLGSRVPDDAAMVLALGPQRPFLPEELAALDRYLGRGGALLLALDPESDFRLGSLEARLGVRFEAVPLADDRQHLRRRANLSDRRLIVTDRFSAHEAVTTLSRTRVGSGILLIGAGYLEPVGDAGPAPSFVVRSLPTTFADANGNFEFDPDSEQRQSYDLVAAVQVPATPSDTGAAPGDAGPGHSEGRRDATGGGRALVYADAGMFTDAVLSSIGLNGALVADGIRWLGGEEAMAGGTASEEDVAIVHTRVEDIAWFYSTILGAPVVVLAAGLVTVFHRRRTAGRRGDRS